ELIQRFTAYGHRNITATHKTTLEITKDENVSLKGSCIVGVSSSIGLKDLREEIKKSIRNKDSIIKLIIKLDNLTEVITGKGDPRLSLSHPTDIVVRKSTYICNRTLMIQSDKAACDLQKEIVKRLQFPQSKLEITIKVLTK
ncbi:MAG: DUF371 domain-containing protein, partial [Candidatus Odinarchaeia archaeon]